ncbi:hypothetical protein FRC10_000153 [Ceratobasidium sp. 414]|nr:hypothetical protein FRC10_000153 [Ceratobasidium sp. 414]
MVYGGGRRGLMGGVAFACAQAGGKVVGVVPQAIKASDGEGTGPMVASESPADEAIWSNVEEIVVASMHERKRQMATQSGAFIGLPGGYGTFEEVLEVVTWNQLGIQMKRGHFTSAAPAMANRFDTLVAVIVLNILGYYEPLRQMIQTGVQAGFIKPQNTSFVNIVDAPSDGDWGKALLEALRTWEPDAGAGYKWTWTEQGMDGI